MSEYSCNYHGPLRNFVVLSLCTIVAGCGGGATEEAAAPEATAQTKSGESTAKPTPTVKGLGSAAKDRQADIDSGAGGAPGAATVPGAPVAATAPGAPAQGASDSEKARMAMAQAQGGRMRETESAPATGAGAAAPGEVPGGGQAGAQAAMIPGGFPGGQAGFGGGGQSGPVLLADNAFLEGGEVLTDQPGGVAGQPGIPGGAGGEAGNMNDFSSPTKAVESFLAATKAKNGDAIGTALSRRSPGEARSPALKKTLENAVAKKLTDEEVAAMSSAFDGYEIVTAGVAKQSGSMNVTVRRQRKTTDKTGKYDRNDYEMRIIRVHRDGNQGWKVVEFGGRMVQD